MAESTLKPEEIKLVLKILKRKGFNCKLNHHSVEDSKEDCLLLKSVHGGLDLRGKLVRSFNQGENYYWSSLNQENLAPLIDVLYIRDDLNIFLTTYQQITLKEIVHDEDFVYDERCFDRKRSYAKGIFDGLSYLHAKSFCLMNLTDDNIAICKVYDKAVITDFSCLVCSKKTTKSEMNVPDIYKAPESEKGNFDVIAAEIWASGTLMLDMFLAHMVPWAVVDYNPKKVMEVIEMLGLDVLQAANAGSTVTSEDLVKFKAFLKCFFKQNPATRVSATNASYASFLHPKCKDKSYRIGYRNSNVCSDVNWTTQHVQKDDHSNSLDFSCFPKQTTNAQFLFKGKTSQETPVPIEHSNSKNICKDIIAFSKQTDVPNFKMDVHVINYPKIEDVQTSIILTDSIADTDTDISRADSEHLIKEKMLEENDNEIGVPQANTSQNILSNRGKGNDLIPAPLPFLYEDSCTVSEIPVDIHHKTTKSCQTIENGTNFFNKSDCTRYQSKSLSFVKSKPDEIKNSAIRFCAERQVSCSSSKSASVKQSSESGFPKNDPCFEDLFGNHNIIVEELDRSKSEEANQSTFEVTKSTGDERKTTESEDPIPIKQIYHSGPYKEPFVQLDKPYRYINKTRLFNEPDFGKIKNQIMFIRQCQESLRNHLRFFVSKHFSYKQRKLLQEYQLLLHQEKLRLYEMLKTKYRQKFNNHVKPGRPLNSELKNVVNHNQNLTQSRNKSPSHNFWQSRYLEAEETKCNAKREAIKIKGYTDQFKDSNITQNFRPNRNQSYCRAIEDSMENAGIQRKLNQANEKAVQTESIFATVYTSEDKLIEPEAFMKVNARADQKPKIEKKTEQEKKDKAETDMKENIDKMTVKNDNIEQNSSKNGKAKKNKKAKNGKKDKWSDKDKAEKSKRVKNGKKDKPPGNQNADEIKRPFFFSLCPGGKVETETLCEACKLHYDLNLI